jgi:hypothetical protein
MCGLDRPRPEGRTLDATPAYVTTPDDGAVRSLAKEGRAPALVAAGEDRPREIVVNEVHTYWIAFRQGAVRSAPKAGGKAVTLVSCVEPGGIAVDATNLYITDTRAGTVISRPRPTPPRR